MAVRGRAVSFLALVSFVAFVSSLKALVAFDANSSINQFGNESISPRSVPHSLASRRREIALEIYFGWFHGLRSTSIECEAEGGAHTLTGQGRSSEL